MVAVGGGCSMAITASRESLSSRCCTVLRSQIEHGDVRTCVRVLALAGACQSPSLAALSRACMSCAQQWRSEVHALAQSEGVDVAAGLTGLAQMQRAYDAY